MKTPAYATTEYVFSASEETEASVCLFAVWERRGTVPDGGDN